MKTRSIFAGFLLLATAALIQPSLAHASTEANLVTGSQFVVGTPTEFTVNISGEIATGSTGQISVEPGTNGTVSKLEQFSSTWSTLSLQTNNNKVSASTQVPSSQLKFRATFSSAGQYVLGFTILDSTGANVLSSTAYPITVSAVLGESTVQFQNNLKFGDKNEDVKNLQARLVVEKLFKVSPTGYFGSITLAAVKAYQKLHGVPTTGFVGPLTRAELNK